MAKKACGPVVQFLQVQSWAKIKLSHETTVRDRVYLRVRLSFLPTETQYPTPSIYHGGVGGSSLAYSFSVAWRAPRRSVVEEPSWFMVAAKQSRGTARREIAGTPHRPPPQAHPGVGSRQTLDGAQSQSADRPP